MSIDLHILIKHDAGVTKPHKLLFCDSAVVFTAGVTFAVHELRVTAGEWSFMAVGVEAKKAPQS